MSTFNGIVSEFPDIRIDFFRNHQNKEPPLACFLSHVHSDHLVGLETLRSPLYDSSPHPSRLVDTDLTCISSVYCSAATRAILLRLERSQCRINYAKRILETRQQTYKHLTKVLKPLPLETPTKLELQPGQHIQVTLFDANHCPGSVMFLIEGDGKAVLYTGDLRCEPWFVNSLARNPHIIEYTHGLKTLDKVYLDTSFIKNIPFQTKAQGIASLLRQALQYPPDTTFYIQSWTYGYEDVWIALSKALNSSIHVDDYKYGVYSSLRARQKGNKPTDDVHHADIAASLVGFTCGNASRPGCLTRDPSVRLHSCESGNMCEVARGKSVVRIRPIVARLKSGDAMQEAGIGGGGEDLEREIELGVASPDDLSFLLEMICTSSESSSGDLRRKAVEKLGPAMTSGRTLSLNIRVADAEQDSPEDLLNGLAAVIRKPANRPLPQPGTDVSDGLVLPVIIHFPYSRHSSYPELCDFLSVFKPKDVWPCTVDRGKWLRESITIESLFGEQCSGTDFTHDLEMTAIAIHETEENGRNDDSQTTETQRSRANSPANTKKTPPACDARIGREPVTDEMSHEEANGPEPDVFAKRDEQVTSTDSCHAAPRKRKRDSVAGSHGSDEVQELSAGSQGTDQTPQSCMSTRDPLQRREAYQIMLQNARGETWNAIDLLSTGNSHNTEEIEL